MIHTESVTSILETYKPVA